MELFLLGLLVVSTLTGLVTEAVKGLCKEHGWNYYANTLAGMVAVVISVLVGVGYIIYVGVPVTAQMVITILALGSLISFNTEGLDFVMTAMFVVIFLEQWFKEKKHYTAVIGIAASVVCLVGFGTNSFLIPTMLCILVLLTIMRQPIEKAGETI